MPLTLHRQSILESENQILAAVAQGRPTSEVLKDIVRNLESISGDVIGSILGLNTETQQLHVLAAPNLPKAYNKAIDGLVIGDGVGSCGTAAFRGTPIVVEDVLQHPFWDDFKAVASKHGLRACWSTPIVSSKQEVLGTFACYYREPKLPSDLEWELMNRLGHLAAIVLEREQSQIEHPSKPGMDQLIVENAADAILVISKEGQILKTNPQCRRLLGYTGAEFSQQGFEKLLMDQTNGSGSFPGHAPTTETTQRVETRLVTKSGTQLPAELHISSLTDGRRLILVHDRSNSSSTESTPKNDRTTELLQKLATCTAEQINQALASIAGHRDLLSTQIAHHPELEKSCQNSLSQILVATQEANAITRQLMAFAQQSPLHTEALDLAQIFGKALINLRRELSPGSSLDIQIGPDVSHFWADSDAFFRVLQLLAQQARLENNTPQRVLLSARERESEGSRLVIIELSYTSPDLCSGDKNTLFEPFALPQSNSLSSGIGLATAHSLINQMKGSLRAKLTPNQRITFEICMPTESLARKQGSSETTSPSPTPSHPESVLVCEDNEAIRLAVEGLLRASGYEVVVAANGEEALTAAAKASRSPAVLVSDIRMPGMDGKELSLKLRERHPNLQIILISGHTGGLVTEEWLRNEKIAFLPKPFSHQSLIQAVKKAFNDYRSVSNQPETR